jgi:hypothetical protein
MNPFLAMGITTTFASSMMVIATHTVPAKSETWLVFEVSQQYQESFPQSVNTIGWILVGIGFPLGGVMIALALKYKEETAKV